jgi:hypothetical protein
MRIWQWQALLGAALVVSSGWTWASSPVTPHTEYYKRSRTARAGTADLEPVRG